MSKSRQEKRDGIKERAMAKANREIATLGRSLSCQWGNHHRCQGGPQHHDTCLCECHDPELPSPSPGMRKERA